MKILGLNSNPTEVCSGEDPISKTSVLVMEWRRPSSMLTQTYDDIWRHRVTKSYSIMTLKGVYPSIQMFVI